MSKADKQRPIVEIEGFDKAGSALAEVAAEAEHAAALIETQKIEIDTSNEFMLGLQGTTIRPIRFPEFTNRQQAYRFMAWLGHMSDMLPDDGTEVTFPEIVSAVGNT